MTSRIFREPFKGRVTADNQPMRGSMERLQGHGPVRDVIPELDRRFDNSTKHVPNSDRK